LNGRRRAVGGALAADRVARRADPLPAGREDRFFPLEMQRRVVRERLGPEVEELPGGHLVALSRPVEPAEALPAQWPEE